MRMTVRPMPVPVPVPAPAPVYHICPPPPGAWRVDTARCDTRASAQLQQQAALYLLRSVAVLCLAAALSLRRTVGSRRQCMLSAVRWLHAVRSTPTTQRPQCSSPSVPSSERHRPAPDLRAAVDARCALSHVCVCARARLLASGGSVRLSACVGTKSPGPVPLLDRC